MSSDSAADADNQKRHASSTLWRQRARRACLCGSGVVSALALGALISGTASAGAPTAAYQISLSATPSSITIRQPITFTGTVSPARAGERPRLRRLVDGRWLLLAVGPELAAGGGFSVTHTFEAPSKGGPTSLRICFARDAYNLHTCSTFTVTISRPARPAKPRRAHRKAIEERRRKHREEARRRREEAHERGKERHQHRRGRAEKHRQNQEEARRRREEKRRK